jgi:hypothetical protein
MDAARLKRARRRMRVYFLGSGVIIAFFYLVIAAFLIRIIGIELTEYASTLMLAAGVMLGGTYAVLMLGYLLADLIRRFWKRQPLMEIED